MNKNTIKIKNMNINMNMHMHMTVKKNKEAFILSHVSKFFVKTILVC